MIDFQFLDNDSNPLKAPLLPLPLPILDCLPLLNHSSSSRNSSGLNPVSATVTISSLTRIPAAAVVDEAVLERERFGDDEDEDEFGERGRLGEE